MDTLQDILEMGQRAERCIEIERFQLLENHQKELRHFTQGEAINYLLTNRNTLTRYCKSAGVKHNRFEGAKWLIDINDIYHLRDEMRAGGTFNIPKFIRQPHQQCHVIPFVNQKGGCTKTTNTLQVSTSLAVTYHEQYRVAVIDMDPQGTISDYLVPARDDKDVRDTIFSVTDMLLGNYTLEEGETIKDVVSNAFLDTTIPNLKVLPASDMDRKFESKMLKRIKDGEVDNPYALLDKMISLVKDEYDFIFIDTAPALNFSVYNALFAATGLIIPVKPTNNDFNATMRWLQRLPDSFAMMSEYQEKKGYDFIRFLISDHDGKDTANEITRKLNNVFGHRVYSTELKSSEAIMTCHKDLNSIFEISKSEYPKTSKVSFANSVTNGEAVTEQIVKSGRDVWYQQDLEYQNG